MMLDRYALLGLLSAAVVRGARGTNTLRNEPGRMINDSTNQRFTVATAAVAASARMRDVVSLVIAFPYAEERR